MVYLADWRSAIERGAQLTALSWRFSFYGPYVPDVVRLARTEEGFEVEEVKNLYGSPAEFVRRTPGAAEGEEYASLAPEDRNLLDFVIGSVQDKGYSEFIKLVYSTYPIATKDRHTRLDLAGLADEYRRVRPSLA